MGGGEGGSIKNDFYAPHGCAFIVQSVCALSVLSDGFSDFYEIPKLRAVDFHGN